jgi:YD repeat-containing protein
MKATIWLLDAFIVHFRKSLVAALMIVSAIAPAAGAELPVWRSSYNHLKQSSFPSLDGLCKAELDAVVASGYTIAYWAGGNAPQLWLVPSGYMVYGPPWGANQCGLLAPPADYSTNPLFYEAGDLFCRPTYSQSGNYCVRSGGDDDKNKGPPPCNCGTEGNPINASNGNKFQIEHDFVGEGAFPLEWTRAYNSFGSAPGNMAFSASPAIVNYGWSPFGGDMSPLNAYKSYEVTLAGNATNSPIDMGWRHNYDRSVMSQNNAHAGTAAVIGPDSKVHRFVRSGSGWVADAGDAITKLQQLVDVNNQPNGWIFTNENGDLETYDASGKLLTIQNIHGLMQTLQYDSAQRLQSVSDPVGRSLVLTYNDHGRLATMTDPANNLYQYEYDDAGNLSRTTYPDGRVRQYLYENPTYLHALTGIVDENSVRFASFGYDANGSAILTEHAGGTNKVTLSYASQISTASDVSGAVRAYAIVGTSGGMLRVGSIVESCGASCSRTRSITYDANGNIASQTDWDGNRTSYAYDLTRSLETSRTEGVGTAVARTITTQWHATFRLPIQITEPGKTTAFAYDTKGNLLQKTISAAGKSRSWTYTYSAAGQVVTVTGPRTDVNDITTNTYDGQGNLASVTNAAGHVTTISNYDGNGHAGTITDPNGLVTNLAYSSRGWLSSRSAGGETTNYDHDGVGQLTKVTQADGSTISYSYDDAHRLTGIADSLGNSVVYTLDLRGNRVSEQVRDPNGALSRQTTRVFDTLNRLQQVTGAQQ